MIDARRSLFPIFSRDFVYFLDTRTMKEAKELVRFMMIDVTFFSSCFTTADRSINSALSSKETLWSLNIVQKYETFSIGMCILYMFLTLQRIEWKPDEQAKEMCSVKGKSKVKNGKFFFRSLKWEQKAFSFSLSLS